MINVRVDKICITQGDTDWSTKKGGVFAIHVVCDDRKPQLLSCDQIM